MPIRDGIDGIGFLRSDAKRPSASELGFELLESQLQRSRALRLDVFGRDLQFAAILVDGDAPANHNLQSVGGTEAQQTGQSGT